jgi:DNA-binding response OmpR family regulator
MANYKILIADYEPRGIQQLSEPLETAGYRVEVAKDGLRAIEAFNTFKPHLTLIEAMLPKKHGFEVCQELKKTQHGSMTPIVIVTSVYKGRKYRTQALHHYGCDEYIEKPIAGDKLVETVHRLIADRCTVEPEPDAPAPAAKPPAAGAGGVASASGRTDGTAEVEIMERLDEILGEPAGPAPNPAATKAEKP